MVQPKDTMMSMAIIHFDYYKMFLQSQQLTDADVLYYDTIVPRSSHSFFHIVHMQS